MAKLFRDLADLPKAEREKAFEEMYGKNKKMLDVAHEYNIWVEEKENNTETSKKDDAKTVDKIYTLTKAKVEEILQNLKDVKVDAELQVCDKRITNLMNEADLITLRETIKYCDRSIAEAKKFLDN